MSVRLADRIQVLRDEVLETAELGERAGSGGEIFDAVVRLLAARGETNPGIDLALHEGISRRLAWGESEAEILADADHVIKNLMRAARRSFRDLRDEMEVLKVSAEVGCAAARIVSMAAVGRASRERSAELREEMSHRRLEQVLERQEVVIRRLESELGEDG